MLFPNLKAEQARNSHTDEDVAGCLNLSRNAYRQKKVSGRFTVQEIHKLCVLYDKPFEYLFATDKSTA